MDIDENDIHDFNLRPFLDPIIGRNWWDWMRDRDWLWENFPAVNGAIGGLDRLRRAGYYLEIVTSKPQWAEYAVWKWLGKWRPPVNRVTIVGPKDIKAEFTDASILIDDKAENISEFILYGGEGILFSRPHNRSVNIAGAYRADNWGQVVDLILDGEPANGEA